MIVELRAAPLSVESISGSQTTERAMAAYLSETYTIVLFYLRMRRTGAVSLPLCLA